MKNSESLDPKENMIETFQSIWVHAKPVEREYITNIWSTLMQPAHVLIWKLTEKHNEYQLVISNEIIGRHSDIPMGELIVEKEMKVVFSEEIILGTERYRQVIQFPEKGISIRIGMGWFSKNNPLQRILFEENQEGQMWCTVEVFGQSIARSVDEALTFWKKIDWQI